MSSTNPYQVLTNDASTTQTEDNVTPAKEEEQVRSKFFNRLVSFPVVKDSLTTVYQYVNDNSLGRYALTSTEGTLQTASVIIAPYVERFSDQLKTMDEMGSKSLDYVEQNYAIVNKPTSEILANVTEPVRQVGTTAKGYLDSTVHVVTWPVDRAAQNILDNLEYAVDRILPVEASQEQQQHQQQESQQKRAYTLALDTKARLMSRLSAVDQIPRSRTELQQTLAANQLLQGAFDRLQRLDQTLRQTTQATRQNLTTPITHISKQVHDKYEAAWSFTDQRINTVTTELINHLDNTIAYVQKHNRVFPESVRSRLQPLVSFASHEYDIVREQVLKTDISSIQKARNVLALSKNYMLPLLKDSMDAIHEELRYYQVYADKSRSEALKTLRGHLESVGGNGIKV